MDSSVSFSGEFDIRIGFRYILALAFSATSSASGKDEWITVSQL